MTNLKPASLAETCGNDCIVCKSRSAAWGRAVERNSEMQFTNALGRREEGSEGINKNGDLGRFEENECDAEGARRGGKA